MAVLDMLFDTPADRRYLTDDIVYGRLTAFRYWPPGSPGSFVYDHLPVDPDQEPLELEAAPGEESSGE